MLEQKQPEDYFKRVDESQVRLSSLPLLSREIEGSPQEREAVLQELHKFNRDVEGDIASESHQGHLNRLLAQRMESSVAEVMLFQDSPDVDNVLKTAEEVIERFRAQSEQINFADGLRLRNAWYDLHNLNAITTHRRTDEPKGRELAELGMQSLLRGQANELVNIVKYLQDEGTISESNHFGMLAESFVILWERWNALMVEPGRYFVRSATAFEDNWIPQEAKRESFDLVATDLQRVPWIMSRVQVKARIKYLKMDIDQKDKLQRDKRYEDHITVRKVPEILDKLTNLDAVSAYFDDAMNHPQQQKRKSAVAALDNFMPLSVVREMNETYRGPNEPRNELLVSLT